MFNTIGDLIVFVRKYLPSHDADQCQFGPRRVELYGKVIATFEPEERSGVPIFTYVGEDPRVKEDFDRIQETNRWKALEELFGWPRNVNILAPEYKWLADKCYYLGTIENRNAFCQDKERLDVFLDVQEMKIHSFTKDREHRWKHFFACNNDDPEAEKEAQRRAWAIIYTKHKPEDFVKPRAA